MKKISYIFGMLVVAVVGLSGGAGRGGDGVGSGEDGDEISRQ